ncbi:MAG: M14 family metallopeptidase [Anaerolineales bacterium]
MISVILVYGSRINSVLPEDNPTYSYPGTTEKTPSPLAPTSTGVSWTATPLPSPIPPTPTPVNIPSQIIGYSVAERPLEVYQFGTGPTQKMIVAGIHGGYEWNTIALANELIDYLSTHPGVVPADQTLYILPAFNPDGFERSRGFGGRANDNNVDLNRNFPSSWQPEWPRAGCWDYIPIEGGSAAASEPETQSLMKFVQKHRISAFISYHSAALGIFPGGQPADPASLSLAEALAEVSEYPYPPIDAGCVFTGQLVDWISDQGIAGVDIELTNHQETDFEINLAILSVFLDWEYQEESRFP